MFTSEAEIDKMYSDHLHSLMMWGGPCDLESVKHEWGQARLNFLAGRLDKPYAV